MNNDHLYSNCIKNINLCNDLNCPDAVKRSLNNGRWYITMGHAGFNTKANNGNGYATKNTALSTMKKLTRRPVNL